VESMCLVWAPPEWLVVWTGGVDQEMIALQAGCCAHPAALICIHVQAWCQASTCHSDGSGEIQLMARALIKEHAHASSAVHACVPCCRLTLLYAPPGLHHRTMPVVLQRSHVP
jgi:hypothetical protein